MDTRRIILFAALALVTMMIFQEWEEYRLAKNTLVTTQASGVVEPLNTPIIDNIEGVPTTPTADTPVVTASKVGELISVTTDLVSANINTLGGNIEYLELNTYPVKLKAPEYPVVLMQNNSRERYIGQSGLTGSTPNLPNHNTLYSASQFAYVLGDGENALDVRLTWSSPEGVEYVKTYTFTRASYRADIRYEVVNNSSTPWSGYFYGQLQRSEPEKSTGGNILTRPMPSFTGGAYYTPEEHYNKVSFSDMEDEPLRFEADSGWTGMLQHYFVSAWLPEDQHRIQIFADSSRGPIRENYKMGFLDLTELQLAPGATGSLGAALFSGPKEQVRLDQQNAEGLKLTVDYGWLTVIAQPLFWIMSKLHDLLGNWGWAIIGVTVLIKLAFLPLSAKSYKSMAKMKKLAPRLKTLKERHGDDRQKYQQAMMELYKKEKVNPASGCLPILIQIPVFIALYWVLLESVEMRQAPWALWIQDLSSKDPYYILPVLMGGSMVVQQLLNPAPMDPMQQKIMMALPVVFTVFFLSFPAGLVLYWVVNNVLSILQQWLISRRYA